MALTPEQLVVELKAKPLQPIYLVAGAEALLAQEAADAIRARARADGFAERVVYDIDERFDWNTLAYELTPQSLYAPRRFVDPRLQHGKPRSDERRVGNEGCSTCRARGWRRTSKKKK